jgi:tetratricopeptide (TPR) repeat protein
MTKTIAKAPLEYRSLADVRAIPWAPPKYVAGVALFLLAVLTYIPSMTNGFIWDDPAYVIDNPTLKSDDGLWRIWTELHATPQYYPMVHTTFWIESRFWGTSSAPGYHVDNILLHALAAVLLWRALLAIGVPWPWLAAAIFAVHPVMVESVAWVTERKNVLSIVFYLLAFHAYRRSGLMEPAEAPDVHPGLPGRKWYLASLALFLLALFSKTVTCSLPAAILLIIWWKRGKLAWTDIKPLLPMFGVGLVMSAVTGHLETTNVGASGPDFQWSAVDRCLIAGHAICFYAMKLAWPHPLMFMYPHWDLHADRAVQCVCPVIVIAIVAILWMTKKRVGRGPVVGVLFFIGTLTPALGFVNVYPMRYSFVADHFQYLASIGIIALFTAMLHGIAKTPAKRGANGMEVIVAIIILAPLSILTWRQQRIYKDAHALWQNTIDQNETCWMAHVNLASVLQREKNIPAAIAQSQRGLQLAPNEADTNYDMGVAFAQQAKWADAADMFRRAIRCDPMCAPAWSYLSLVLWEHFDTPQDKANASLYAQKALSVGPNANLSVPHYVLGCAAEYLGNYQTALEEFRQALTIDPKDFHSQYNAGLCLLRQHHPEEAAFQFLKVLDHDPRDTAALCGLGDAYLEMRKAADAARAYRQALSIDPKLEPASNGLKKALGSK